MIDPKLSRDIINRARVAPPSPPIQFYASVRTLRSLFYIDLNGENVFFFFLLEGKRVTFYPNRDVQRMTWRALTCTRHTNSPISHHNASAVMHQDDDCRGV